MKLLKISKTSTSFVWIFSRLCGYYIVLTLSHFSRTQCLARHFIFLCTQCPLSMCPVVFKRVSQHPIAVLYNQNPPFSFISICIKARGLIPREVIMRISSMRCTLIGVGLHSDYLAQCSWLCVNTLVNDIVCSRKKFFLIWSFETLQLNVVLFL